MKWLMAILTLGVLLFAGCSTPDTNYTATTVPPDGDQALALPLTGPEEVVVIPELFVDLPDPETLATIARGRIVITAPEQMSIDSTETVIVSITQEELEAIEEEVETIEEEIATEIPVAQGLRLKLTLGGSEDFNVIALTDETQTLSPLGARWAWRVDGHDPGTSELVLIASIRANEEFITLNVFEQQLSVKDTWGHRWRQVDIELGATTLVLISGAILAWYKVIKPRRSHAKE